MQEAYVLNLPHRIDRWNQIQEDFKNTNFKLIQHFGVMITDSNISDKDKRYYGVAKTHQQLIQQAKDKNLKTILILEDDCKPEPKFEEHWFIIKEYLDNHLDDWEVFNGGICGVESISKCVKIITNNDPLYIIKEKGGCFCHWLYLNVEKAYDKLMAWDITKMEIDLYYSFCFSHYTCFPLLAEQHNGYSDIGSREKDWGLNFQMARLSLRRHIMSICP